MCGLFEKMVVEVIYHREKTFHWRRIDNPDYWVARIKVYRGKMVVAERDENIYDGCLNFDGLDIFAPNEDRKEDYKRVPVMKRLPAMKVLGRLHASWVDQPFKGDCFYTALPVHCVAKSLRLPALAQRLIGEFAAIRRSVDPRSFDERTPPLGWHQPDSDGCLTPDTRYDSDHCFSDRSEGRLKVTFHNSGLAGAGDDSEDDGRTREDLNEWVMQEMINNGTENFPVRFQAETRARSVLQEIDWSEPAAVIGADEAAQTLSLMEGSLIGYDFGDFDPHGVDFDADDDQSLSGDASDTDNLMFDDDVNSSDTDTRVEGEDSFDDSGLILLEFRSSGKYFAEFLESMQDVMCNNFPESRKCQSRIGNAWVFVHPHHLPQAWSMAYLQGHMQAHKVIISTAMKGIFDAYMAEFMSGKTKVAKKCFRLRSQTPLTKLCFQGSRLGGPLIGMRPKLAVNTCLHDGFCVRKTFLELQDSTVEPDRKSTASTPVMHGKHVREFLSEGRQALKSDTMSIGDDSPHTCQIDVKTETADEEHLLGLCKQLLSRTRTPLDLSSVSTGENFRTENICKCDQTSSSDDMTASNTDQHNSTKDLTGTVMCLDCGNDERPDSFVEHHSLFFPCATLDEPLATRAHALRDYLPSFSFCCFGR